MSKENKETILDIWGSCDTTGILHIIEGTGRVPYSINESCPVKYYCMSLESRILPMCPTDYTKCLEKMKQTDPALYNKLFPKKEKEKSWDDDFPTNQERYL